MASTIQSQKVENTRAMIEKTMSQLQQDVRRYPLVTQAVANFAYGSNSEDLARLYNKAKDRQWDARSVVDWAVPLDDENPLGMPQSTFPLARSRWFLSLAESKRVDVVRSYHGWMVAQFLHGEQFGVLTASRIAMEAADHDSKLFAAIQAVDEARHLETYATLAGKIGTTYSISRPFGQFLDSVITAKSIDLVYLGLQIIGEGIGLASFSLIRKATTNPIIAEIYSRIMEDEARHVAFGRLFLGPLYRQLSKSELSIREEFVMNSLSQMSERFYALEVWESYGLDHKQAVVELQNSPSFRIYRRELFNQIVPMIKDIGLWTRPVQEFMGVVKDK